MGDERLEQQLDLVPYAQRVRVMGAAALSETKPERGERTETELQVSARGPAGILNPKRRRLYLDDPAAEAGPLCQLLQILGVGVVVFSKLGLHHLHIAVITVAVGTCIWSTVKLVLALLAGLVVVLCGRQNSRFSSRPHSSPVDSWRRQELQEKQARWKVLPRARRTQSLEWMLRPQRVQRVPYLLDEEEDGGRGGGGQSGEM
ncbi:hypothetical protein EYF80_038454 [Liparis tanakae]|uniref:Uncharacterized protein n=1 Tax=Liparis tanakae TaxID=230148 RepID=A0A4Z2GCQ9_9TELE|nr:hypothetical protein EYF80_038454 [Liparis tanakae]